MPPRNASNAAHPSCPSLCLRDSLALGEVESGLWADKQEEEELEEIERLPVLLRLLSASRPHTSIPTVGGQQCSDGGDDNEQQDGNEPTIDELANSVVARLEDVAATYSVAEGVDVDAISQERQVLPTSFLSRSSVGLMNLFAPPSVAFHGRVSTSRS